MLLPTLSAECLGLHVNMQTVPPGPRARPARIDTSSCMSALRAQRRSAAPVCCVLAGLLARHRDSTSCCKVHVSFCFSLPLLQKKEVDEIQMSHCLTPLPAGWLLPAGCGTAAQAPDSRRLSGDAPVKMWDQMPSHNRERRRRNMGDAEGGGLRRACSVSPWVSQLRRCRPC